MVGVQIIEYKGKEILYQDISDSPDFETNMAVFEKTKEMAQKKPLKSILLLTNVTNTKYDSRGVEYIKQFTKDTAPYTKASAAVGIDGIKKLILQSLNAFKELNIISGNKIKMFDTIEEAKDWLVEQ